MKEYECLDCDEEFDEGKVDVDKEGTLHCPVCKSDNVAELEPEDEDEEEEEELDFDDDDDLDLEEEDEDDDDAETISEY